jgi:hypothetical protein
VKAYFFSAGKPIVKSYLLSARKKLKKVSYPALFKFTSFEYTVNTIQDLHLCITEHAAHGNCLLKGQLQRPLKNEQRAGTTSPDSSTMWICLDFDGLTAFTTVTKALNAMGCGDTDYILQWSASNKVEEKPGLNCHIFMLLEELQHPSLLKQWLKHLNLTLLKTQELARSGNSLLWPIDITTCQNDKLLYIAPPKFRKGTTDPIPDDRISLVKKKYRTLDLDVQNMPPPNSIQEDELVALNRLRKASGFKPRKQQLLQTEFDLQYLSKPDAAQVTGIKTEREFVYFNLNGGDSWGYYHPVDNPTFIYNFKGEPLYRTEDLLPSYWAEIRARVTNLEPNAGGHVYLAFRDFESATYWNGVYDAATDRINKLAQARSESQLRHFMKQHGQPLGDFIPDWEMVFEPMAGFTIDQKKKRLNIYKPSEHFARPPAKQAVVPPTIEKVIYHVLGSENRAYEHFLNRLAVIVQNLDMTQTAWVIHGTQGTGKGVMFNHILTPLFGAHNVTSRRMEELGSDFTEFMKNKFLVFIDEVQTGNSLFHERVAAKLKNLIVEPFISVREMYKPSTIMRNFTNLIFASNNPRPVAIAPDDRRFNVGKYQDKPISITSSDIAMLETEVPEFYNYLCTRIADRDIARHPIESEDRDHIINLSRPSIDIAIEALKQGNSQFFIDMLIEKEEILSPKVQVAYSQYSALIAEIKDSGRAKITRDEIFIILRWCVDGIPEAPNKFTTMLRHHGLTLKPIWISATKTSVRGIDIGQWN